MYRRPCDRLAETVVLRVSRLDSKRERVRFGDRPIGYVEQTDSAFVALAGIREDKTASLGRFCDRPAAIAQLIAAAQPVAVR